jgi:hypothetical protein
MKTTLPYAFVGVLKKYTICVFALMALLFLSLTLSAQPTVTTGKSYINLTRPNGGTFFPGDTIEVRATIAVSGGDNSSSANRVNSIRYNDTLNLTKLLYIPNSLTILNNEGRPQRATPYTEASDNDSAHYDPVTGRLRFNIGNGAGKADLPTQGISITNAGSMWGALFPTFYKGTCIRMYVYRVKILTAAAIVDIDTTIRLSAGNFRYRIGNSVTDVVSNFSPYLIKISPDFGLCSNAIGANALISESGGTFGSGHNRNRTTTSALVPLPYTRKMFSSNTPNDNFYGLANNTSGTWGFNNDISQNNPIRVFNVWEITGDHTGAASLTSGNPPTDTTIAGAIGGYALIINASYETNYAFSQTITNLCENTYYEFSAWFKNICRRCSCDSSGTGANQAGYKPGTINPVFGTPDSSGVRPNLTFKIDSFDYYTTGNMPFSKTWVKKGFIYRTKPGQTSFTITIRNNAPGGGGNDWAIDDIGVATCLPNMKYSPSLTPNVCNNNALTIYDTVRSFFNNYVYYQWQRSTDGGTVWTNIGAPIGPVVPTLVGGNWQYVAAYTVPPTATFPGNAGDKYRVIVATSTTNLSDINCRSTDATNTVTLSVTVCGPILNVNMASFSGVVAARKANLKWTTTAEEEQYYFDIEKSFDGSSFTVIGTVNGYNNSGQINQYNFIDLTELSAKAFYRIRMRTIDNRNTYSRILELSADTEPFSFTSVVNPFANTLYFDISSVKTGMVKVELIDHFGIPVRKKVMDIREGVNQFYFDNTSILPPGMYILRAQMDGAVITKKVMKQIQ